MWGSPAIERVVGEGQPPGILQAEHLAICSTVNAIGPHDLQTHCRCEMLAESATLACLQGNWQVGSAGDTCSNTCVSASMYDSRVPE